MTTPPATPTPGQARKPAGAAVLQPDKTDAIVTAFYDELTDSGHDKLTMDRVAARAGVGKALGGDKDASAPDLGSLRDDLYAWFTDAIAIGHDPLSPAGHGLCHRHGA